jgi:hypothetical protein
MNRGGEESELSKQVHLSCTLCSEEFMVPISVYRAHVGVVACPWCGCTDLVLLGERNAAVSGHELAEEQSHPNMQVE